MPSLLFPSPSSLYFLVLISSPSLAFPLFLMEVATCVYVSSKKKQHPNWIRPCFEVSWREVGVSIFRCLLFSVLNTCATILEMNRNKDIICTAATVNKCSRDSWSCVHACLYIQTTESKVLVPSLYDR